VILSADKVTRLQQSSDIPFRPADFCMSVRMSVCLPIHLSVSFFIQSGPIKTCHFTFVHNLASY